jgi:hypothetical protein
MSHVEIRSALARTSEIVAAARRRVEQEGELDVSAIEPIIRELDRAIRELSPPAALEVQPAFLGLIADLDQLRHALQTKLGVLGQALSSVGQGDRMTRAYRRAGR